jgi:hypothetical protein
VGHCPLISPVTCLQTGARRAGSIPARLPESHQDAALSRGFPAENQDISGFAGRNLGCALTLAQSGGPGRADGRGVRREPPARRRGRRHGDRAGCVSLWWPAGGGPRPWRGRLAQRESASFTPRRSLVRSQYRPPRSQASSPRGTGLRRLSCRNGCSCHRPSRLCAPRRTPYPALRICSRRMSACPQCWANSRRVCR